MTRRLGYVLGIGVDILRMSRFEHILLNRNNQYIMRLSKRILHKEKELPKFQQLLQEKKIDQCVKYISGSWASKEAVFKTLELQDQKLFAFKDWYRYYNESGKPHIRNDKYGNSEQFLLSLSHDGDILIANVLRQCTT